MTSTRRACAATTQAGLPCPANARRRPDPDGQHRCPHHTVEPSVREAIRLSRHRGAFRTQELIHAGPAVVAGERYLTAESLDLIFDEALNVMRMELRTRKTNKGQAATAIVALADAKLRIRQMSWMANATRRLNPVNPVRDTPA